MGWYRILVKLEPVNDVRRTGNPMTRPQRSLPSISDW